MIKKAFIVVVAALFVSACSSEISDKELIEQAVKRVPDLEPMFMPVNANGVETMHCLSRQIVAEVTEEHFILIGVPIADSNGKYDCRNYLPK